MKQSLIPKHALGELQAMVNKQEKLNSGPAKKHGWSV
jgi:hypothetical protein